MSQNELGGGEQRKGREEKNSTGSICEEGKYKSEGRLEGSI